MLFHDLALLDRDDVLPRMLGLAIRAHAAVAGPEAGLTDRVRAAQAVAMLGDPVVFLAEVPDEVLRREMLGGLRRLLGGRSGGRPAAVREPVMPSGPPTRGRVSMRRGPGRPRVLTPEKVALARRLLAAGTRSITDVAAELGVSRATLYRHLG
jgi:transcriptional regulator of acetoin/glycerol metabolism